MLENPLNVLLIEEDQNDTELVRQMIGEDSGAPYRLECSSSIEEGLQRLRQGNIHVILLGVSGPGALAAGDVDTVHRAAGGVPIIVLTSLDETAVLLDTARGGAVDYFVKSRMNRRELSLAIRYAAERSRIEEARRAAEASLRELVHSNSDAMVVVDEEGIVQFVNPAAERLFGRALKEFVGRPFDFDVDIGDTTEVKVETSGEKPATAEMRVVETTWEGEPAKLASLRDITDIVRLREKLRAMTLHDELTGLYNRRGLMTLAEQQIKLADRRGDRLLFLFLDLDGFKSVNDQYGHARGDEALGEVARVLTDSFRESDILARVGGDEFLVLAIGARKMQASTLADHFRRKINAALAKSDLPCPLTVSLGAAYREPRDERSIEELIAQADAAMYQHKERTKSETHPRTRRD